jgi:D-serine deaminase-like pyridoxal phosphate-dependent protein
VIEPKGTLPAASSALWRDKIETPAVLIDLDVVERNIARCQKRCDELGLAVRPHIKTHKLPLLAHAQLAAGAVGVTAQKIGEAEVMAAAGITDIFISYNIVGAKKLDRLRQLANATQLTVTADSRDVVSGLAAAFVGAPRPLNVLVECDTGMHRCGVDTPEAAVELAHYVDTAAGLHFAGLMTYPAPGAGTGAIAWLAEAARLCREAGLSVDVVSSGGTPDLYRFRSDPAVTEYRPGSYIYNDRSLLASQACQEIDCALTVATTVISVPSAGKAIIDAGSKVLTSDLFGLDGYGFVVGRADISVPQLNEEHGHLKLAAHGPALVVGQTLRIVPNHACVVSNMVDHVHLVRGEHYVRQESVAARGKVL